MPPTARNPKLVYKREDLAALAVVLIKLEEEEKGEVILPGV